MPIDLAATKALDASKLPPLPHLKVVSMTAEEHTDWTGDDSLRVTVILDEAVDVEKVTGKEVGDLKWAIREQLQAHGITLFPYIFLAKQSEFEDMDEGHLLTGP